MKLTPFIPPSKTLPAKSKEDIQSLKKNPNCTPQQWTALAKKYGVPVAIQEERKESGHFYLHWFNPKTGETKKLPADPDTHKPLLDPETALRLAASDETLNSFLEDLTLLESLGVIKTPENPNKTHRTQIANIQEFDPEALSFSNTTRTARISTTPEGIRITLGKKPTDPEENPLGEDTPDIYLETTDKGWRIFAHPNKSSEPTAKITITDHQNPHAENLQP